MKSPLAFYDKGLFDVIGHNLFCKYKSVFHVFNKNKIDV